MLETVREWIIGLTGAAVLTALCMALSPEGRVRRVTALACGLVMIIMLIKPVVGFDYTSFSRNYVRLKAEAGEFSDVLGDVNEKLTGVIIEEACSAYILDKGMRLGMNDLEAAVFAQQSEEGYFYPGAARLVTDADKELRDKLGYAIEAELGIPAEELKWSMHNED